MREKYIKMPCSLNISAKTLGETLSNRHFGGMIKLQKMEKDGPDGSYLPKTQTVTLKEELFETAKEESAPVEQPAQEEVKEEPAPVVVETQPAPVVEERPVVEEAPIVVEPKPVVVEEPAPAPQPVAQPKQEVAPQKEEPQVEDNSYEGNNLFAVTTPVEETPKRKAGRPRKILTQEEIEARENKEKRGRGRPRKILSVADLVNEGQEKRGRGRPKKEVSDEGNYAEKRGRGRPRKSVASSEFDSLMAGSPEQEELDKLNAKIESENKRLAEHQEEFNNQINQSLFRLSSDEEDNR